MTEPRSTKEIEMTETEKTMRAANLAHIRKQMRSKAARDNAWPGAPLSHFEVTGAAGDVFRAMIADGSVRIVERPKPSGATACFVCLPG